MERGYIVRWRYTNDIDNRGVILGCSEGVNGRFFAFRIEDVFDPTLAGFLRMTAGIMKPRNCAAPPSIHWVFFTAVGTNVATSVSRIFG